MGEKKKILTQDKRVRNGVLLWWEVSQKNYWRDIWASYDVPCIRMSQNEPSFNLFKDIRIKRNFRGYLSSIQPEVSELAEEMIRRKINKILESEWDQSIHRTCNAPSSGNMLGSKQLIWIHVRQCYGSSNGWKNCLFAYSGVVLL